MDNLLLKTDVERMLFAECQAQKAQTQQARSDAALVIHALDCALALCEALMVNLPSGQPVDPGVGAAKGALDNAMAAIRRNRGAC